jgi:hypothetical protein
MADQRFTAAPHPVVVDHHRSRRINAVLTKSKYGVVLIFFAAGFLYRLI